MAYLTDSSLLPLSPLDWSLVLILGGVMPLVSYMSRRKFLRQPPADVAHWRRRAYLENAILLWGLCAFGLLVWFVQDRDVIRPGLGVNGDFWSFLAVTLLVVGACIALLRPLTTEAAEKQRSAQKVLEDDPFLSAFIPASQSDMPGWMALSVTAGVTEEILYRGLLLGTLTPLLGLPWAAIVSVFVFSLGHAYQGPVGMLRVAGVGAVLTAVVLLAGSIWPAVLLHIAVDISSGRAFLVLKQLNDDRSRDVENRPLERPAT